MVHTMMARTLSDRWRRTTFGILVGAWLFTVVPLAAAQEVDSRWAPWIGCWTAVDETAMAPLLCVVPLAGESAVEMLTVLEGQVVSRESIVADGQQRPVSREECEGLEQAEFSDDSRRIYVRSELDCRAGGARSSTSVMSIVSPYEWLDVRTVEVDGQSVPWVLRYRQALRADYEAAGQADLLDAQGSDGLTARLAASRPIALDDVIEASGKVSAVTLQIWVAERGEPFALDGNRLIEMADAGVPAGVIDVVIAVSYPEKFVVNDGAPSEPRFAEARRGGGRSALGCSMSLNPFQDPFYDPYGRYSYGARRYGIGYNAGYGYGYGGYGGCGAYGGYGGGYNGYGGFGGFGALGYGFDRYGSYGGFGGFGGYGYGGTVVVVDRRSDLGSGGAGGTSTRGRVVRGGGYTSDGGGGTSTGRSAQPRSSGGSGGGASARSSGGSSGGSSASPARAPRSSPRSTGRTARPRPPGGRN